MEHRAGPADGRPTGLVAVVTGASSGIGAATARRLSRESPAHLVLVARRRDRLEALARELGPFASALDVDLVEDGAPERVRDHLERTAAGRLTLLVNNAGSAWRGAFGETGWANVQRTMALNFDAQLRLTEALLPLLRASAPSAVVNVSSTAAHVTRARTGAYSASKAALRAWSDALRLEEAPYGVHVGLVMPGFIATEGFPQTELRGRLITRWAVSTPERAAEAVVQAGLGHRAERYVPRPYALAAAARVLAPGLVRRALGGGAASALTTETRERGRRG